MLPVTSLAHTAYQSFLERAESAAAFPGGHRTTQAVRLARRETGCDHRELHDLLLENRYAQRALQNLAHPLARIDDGLLARTPAQVRVHHVALDRARANDRDLDDEVVVAARFEPRQHRHLRARFDLEYAHRVAITDHVVHAWILGRYRRERVFPAIVVFNQVEAAAYRRQHAEAQDIHFKKPEILEIVLLPLDDRAILHCGILDRNQPR